jgi:hypothetical protein
MYDILRAIIRLKRKKLRDFIHNPKLGRDVYCNHSYLTCYWKSYPGQLAKKKKENSYKYKQSMYVKLSLLADSMIFHVSKPMST